MKISNLLFLVGAITILLIFSFSSLMVWALFNEKNNDPFLQKQDAKKATTIEIKEIIKEVPVTVYIHDTVRLKITCHKQHYETKNDTAK